MIELEQAIDQILDYVGRLQAQAAASRVEAIPIGQADGRYLAESVRARCELPAFDNSAMDGYAVRAEDVAHASATDPVPLRVIGQIAAGETLDQTIGSGTCARIFTGSPLPPGADAVVMQEDTDLDSARAGTVLIKDKARAFENVRLRGEEIKGGAEVAAAGSKLTPGKVGLLAAVGISQVKVSRQPVVALVATGSELVEPAQDLTRGRIFESNRYMLAPAVAKAGGVPNIFPLVPDTREATHEALRKAFEQANAVITSGGVSVGEYDFVKAAFEDLGGKLDFWKVAVKPGKPFVFGHLRDKLLFGLPGNPVSACVTFMLLVRPALLRWQGATEVHLTRHPAVLGEHLTNRAERRHFMSVRVNPDGKVYSAGLQASHAIAALANANGLVDVPPRMTLSPGALVQVLRWDAEL